jgi:hypothetical protein
MYFFMSEVVKLPSKIFVPSERTRFIENGGLLRPKNIFKYLKRRLVYQIVLRWLGLRRPEARITRFHKKILWISLSAPSLGDSLMDTSSRVLLDDREVDLFTTKKIAELYQFDSYFRAVYFSRSAVRLNSYDLIICDSYAPRVVKEIFLISCTTPWTTMYGFVNGFDLNRTIFSFSRMMELLDLDSITKKLTPVMRASHTKKVDADVFVAIGGEWEFRTYIHWEEVVRVLVTQGRTVHLIGSQNALAMERHLLGLFPTVTTSVGNSITEVAAEISGAPVLVCADGGLWHMGCALGIPTVVLSAECLFTDEQGNDAFRNTNDLVCETLVAKHNVNEIRPQAVCDAFEKMMNRLEQK